MEKFDISCFGGPLWAAVRAYGERSTARFHMPGHKGRGVEDDPLSPVYPYDITEVAGADSLYEDNGAILALEERFAQLYGAKRTLISAGGSTLCIQTMLALVARPGGVIIAGRGAHVAAVNAMALLDITPAWVLPEGGAGFGLGGRICPAAVEEALTRQPDACAVYLTSPDFFGVMSDVAAIAAVCRRFRVPLLVDNAHGSHLKWRAEGSLHPMDLGAAMCCDSPHKTLPVLTGGALLHIAEEGYVPNAKRCMALFGSTSPSYLIMLSLDRCLALLEHGYGARFEAVRTEMRTLSCFAALRGFQPLAGACDDTKLALSVWNWALAPQEFTARLCSAGLEPEYCGPAWSVLMASPENTPGDFARVRRFLERWEVPAAPVQAAPPMPALPQRVLSLRAAALAPTQRVPVEQSAGCTAGATVCPCPPGIPIVTPGELIDEACAASLKKCGILFVDVVK